MQIKKPVLTVLEIDIRVIIMVCVPCIVIPILLYIWHRWLQPIALKIWNPWGKVSEHYMGTLVHHTLAL